MEIRSYAIILI